MKKKIAKIFMYIALIIWSFPAYLLFKITEDASPYSSFGFIGVIFLSFFTLMISLLFFGIARFLMQSSN